MTKAEQHEKADQIASKHGCEIQPGAFGQTCLVVARQHQQGFPADRARLAACRAELNAIGIDTSRWVSN